MPNAVKELKLHLDDRGFLFEVLRNDDEIFEQFGQAYISATNPGVVKGFHRHFHQTDFITCVSGQIKLVTVEILNPPLITEHHLSPLDPKLIMVRPFTYHGWMAIGPTSALVLNITDIPFDPASPDEERIDPHNNPWHYKWGIKDR